MDTGTLKSIVEIVAGISGLVLIVSGLATLIGLSQPERLQVSDKEYRKLMMAQKSIMIAWVHNRVTFIATPIVLISGAIYFVCMIGLG